VDGGSRSLHALGRIVMVVRIVFRNIPKDSIPGKDDDPERQGLPNGDHGIHAYFLAAERQSIYFRCQSQCNKQVSHTVWTHATSYAFLLTLFETRKPKLCLQPKCRHLLMIDTMDQPVGQLTAASVQFLNDLIGF